MPPLAITEAKFSAPVNYPVLESASYTRLPDLLSRGDRAVNRRVGQFCRPESTAIMTASVKQTGSGCKFLRVQMSVADFRTA
jgi:hypothetical protein